MSSFRKRNVQKSIPDTRISPHTGQLITSTGNLWLDAILGGGLSVGSICLIEEDKYALYAKVLAKYFIAEGETAGHSTWLANLDDEPLDILKKLPVCIDDTDEVNKEMAEIELEDKSHCAKSLNNDLRIAWRYTDLPLLNAKEKNITIGHHFNLLKQMDFALVTCRTWSGFTPTPDNRDMNNDDSITQTLNDSNSIMADASSSDKEMSSAGNDSTESTQSCGFTNTKYESCIQAIVHFQNRRFEVVKNDEYPAKRLARLCIMSLGSPLWYEQNFEYDVLKFLTILRAVVRSSPAVCFITMPMHLIAKYSENMPDKIRNLVDYAIELESFVGSTNEENPVLKDYNGIVKFHKVTALNTLNVYQPETLDLAFKLRRKRFIIEKLHLPPEIQNDANETNEKSLSSPVMPTMNCSSGGGGGGLGSKQPLDF